MVTELSFGGRAVACYDPAVALWRPLHCMVVEDGCITALDVGEPAREGECFDLYMLPGFIDAHCHLLEDPYGNEPSGELVCDERSLLRRAVRNACDALAGGTTTVKDLGGRGFSSVAMAARINASMPIGALTSGCYFTSPSGHCHDRGAVVISSLDEFERGLEALRVLRVRFCKLVHGDSGFSSEVLEGMVEAAHKVGMLVSCHAYTEKAAAEAVAAGADILEHAGDYSDRLLEDIRRRDTIVVPTFVSAYDSTFANCDALSDVDESVIAEWYRGEQVVVPKLYERGIKVALGSDAGFEGTPFGSVAREIQLLHEVEGISVADLMRSAFIVTPKTVGLSDKLGRISVGYRADFQLFEANPVADPGLLGHPVEVWTAGARVPLDVGTRAVVAPLTAGNAGEVAELAAQPYFDCANLSDFWTEGELERWLGSNTDYCVGAFVRGKLVGYCLSHLHAATGKVHLENVYVDDACRGNGIAGLMLGAVVGHYRATCGELRFVALVAPENHASLRVLEKFEFGRGETMLWMQKNE